MVVSGLIGSVGCSNRLTTGVQKRRKFSFATRTAGGMLSLNWKMIAKRSVTLSAGSASRPVTSKNANLCGSVKNSCRRRKPGYTVLGYGMSDSSSAKPTRRTAFAGSVATMLSPRVGSTAASATLSTWAPTQSRTSSWSRRSPWM